MLLMTNCLPWLSTISWTRQLYGEEFFYNSSNKKFDLLPKIERYCPSCIDCTRRAFDIFKSRYYKDVKPLLKPLLF